MIRSGDLHLMLAEEAERRGVTIARAKRLTALDAGHGVARFADGSELEADIVVGCDGLRSTVRALVFPDAPPPRFSGLYDYGGFSPLVPPALAPGVNEMIFGRRAFFGAFVTPRGETWWFHNGPPPDASSTGEASRERLLALHADDPAWIGEVIRATPAVLGPFPLFEIDSLPAWSHARVVLLGDAAHALSPSAGQGASLAIEDALLLARSLARSRSNRSEAPRSRVTNASGVRASSASRRWRAATAAVRRRRTRSRRPCAIWCSRSSCASAALRSRACTIIVSAPPDVRFPATAARTSRSARFRHEYTAVEG